MALSSDCDKIRIEVNVAPMHAKQFAFSHPGSTGHEHEQVILSKMLMASVQKQLDLFFIEQFGGLHFLAFHMKVKPFCHPFARIRN